jgi:hypothetical protein
MALELKMNVNDNVWVELTEDGWNAIRNYYTDLFNTIPGDMLKGVYLDNCIGIHKDRTKKYKDCHSKDIVSLTQFQMHELMHIFGDVTYIGQPNMFVDNTIYLTIDNFIEQ